LVLREIYLFLKRIVGFYPSKLSLPYYSCYYPTTTLLLPYSAATTITILSYSTPPEYNIAVILSLFNLVIVKATYNLLLFNSVIYSCLYVRLVYAN